MPEDMKKHRPDTKPAGRNRRGLHAPEQTRLPAKGLELYRLVMDAIHDGAVLTDPDGYILYFNKPYGRFLGIDAEGQIGRHVTDVIENTRMHIVAKTGKAEMNVVQRIKGQDMVVQRIPIRKNGKIIAVFGQVMFERRARHRKAWAEALHPRIEGAALREADPFAPLYALHA